MSEPAGDSLAGVRALEERAFNAWPALQTEVADGWLLRFADGYTKRANSLNAWQPAVPVGSVLAHARTRFAARGLPLIVRVSPLAGAATDRELAAIGFARIDETIVMTAPLSRGGAGRECAVRIAGSPTDAWLSGFAAANAVPAPRRAIHDRMLASISHPVAFASLEAAGGAVAWGLAVVERDMVGLFDIVVTPAARRQAAGHRLVAGLLGWASTQGAATAYLQVVATNAPAIALYARLGFGEAYRYHYRIALD